MKKSTMTSAILLGALFSVPAMAQMHGSMPQVSPGAYDRTGPLTEKGTLDLCVEYAVLDDQQKRQEYWKELEMRGQLSHKDHKLIPQHKVENSMTMCGMYMAKGKPLAEQSRQIRPMTFKTVHVYPDMYYVTQSGMVVGSYERKEGSMPPALAVEKPKVEPSPMQH